MAAYQWRMDKHNNPACSCDYCIKLRPYVVARLALHRQKKYMSSTNYFTPGFDDFYHDQMLLNHLKGKVALIKGEKDQLKSLTIGKAIITMDDDGRVLSISHPKP